MCNLNQLYNSRALQFIQICMDLDISIHINFHKVTEICKAYGVYDTQCIVF